MAINISNIGNDWCIKFFREEWFFKDLDEFTPVFVFLLDNNVGYHLCPKSGGFSISMVDANLKSFDYANVLLMVKKCIDFKQQFGDKNRLMLIF